MVLASLVLPNPIRYFVYLAAHRPLVEGTIHGLLWRRYAETRFHCAEELRANYGNQFVEALGDLKPNVGGLATAIQMIKARHPDHDVSLIEDRLKLFETLPNENIHLPKFIELLEQLTQAIFPTVQPVAVQRSTDLLERAGLEAVIDRLAVSCPQVHEALTTVATGGRFDPLLHTVLSSELGWQAGGDRALAVLHDSELLVNNRPANAKVVEILKDRYAHIVSDSQLNNLPARINELIDRVDREVPHSAQVLAVAALAGTFDHGLANTLLKFPASFGKERARQLLTKRLEALHCANLMSDGQPANDWVTQVAIERIPEDKRQEADRLTSWYLSGLPG